jgi:hypothetical protein
LHAVYCNRPENQERYATGREAGWKPGMDLEVYDNDPREQDIVRPMQALVERMQIGTSTGIQTSIDMVPFSKPEPPAIGTPQRNDSPQEVNLSKLGVTGGHHHNEGELNELSPSSLTKAPSRNQRAQNTSTNRATQQRESFER